MNRGLKFTETDLKRQCNDLLNKLGIYNWPVTAGLGSHPGQPDRIAHIHHTIVYIEYKLPKGRLSQGTLVFQEQCVKDDVPYIVIHSIEELEAKLRELRVLR
jgi:hypothetical protein